MSKETINKTKRQSTERENIFVNYVSDKRLISKIYEELIQLNSNKSDNLIKNSIRSEDTFFQRRHTNCQQVHEKVQHHLLSEKLKSNHNAISLHTFRMAIIKKVRNKKYWQGCGKKGNLFFCCGNANWCSHYGKLKIELPYDPAILLLGIYPQEVKSVS